ncbi:MAG: methyltransferase domain-containing protein [Caldilineaceae bacterium]
MTTKDLKTAVQQQFGQVAANYSTSTVHAQGRDLEAMLRAVQLTGDETVLDAGCGAGHTALAFAPQVKGVTAVDFTTTMLEQGRRLAAERSLHNVEFRPGDVEQLPFADASFDLVVSRYSAHHWPHPGQALREFRRVLRPGGALILDDIVSYDDYICDTYLQTIEVLRDPSHVRDHTVHQWLDLMAAAGFTQTEVVYRGGVWIDFAAWIQRMATPSANAAMIRTLFDGAPQEFKEALQIEANHNFTFAGAVLRAYTQ